MGHPRLYKFSCVVRFHFLGAKFCSRVRGLHGNRSDYNVWFCLFLPIGIICWNVRGVWSRWGEGMSKAWASPWWYEDVTSCLQAIHNIPMSAREQTDIWRKEGANCPQSDRRRRETHRGNSILCKIKTDGHTGADQFEIIDLLGTVQKFLPQLFPQAQNKNRSLNKSELWKVLFCYGRQLSRRWKRQWNFTYLVLTVVSLETLVTFPNPHNSSGSRSDSKETQYTYTILYECNKVKALNKHKSFLNIDWSLFILN